MSERVGLLGLLTAAKFLSLPSFSSLITPLTLLPFPFHSLPSLLSPLASLHSYHTPLHSPHVPSPSSFFIIILTTASLYLFFPSFLSFFPFLYTLPRLSPPLLPLAASCIIFFPSRSSPPQSTLSFHLTSLLLYCSSFFPSSL